MAIATTASIAWVPGMNTLGDPLSFYGTALQRMRRHAADGAPENTANDAARTTVEEAHPRSTLLRRLLRRGMTARS